MSDINVPNRFAKLFNIEGISQVLAMVTSGEEGPEFRLISTTKSGHEVCVTRAFADTDEGWDHVEKLLDGYDEDAARRFADSNFSLLESIQG